MNPREWKNSVLIILVLLVLAILVCSKPQELRNARILIGSLHLGQSTQSTKGSSPGAERSAIEKAPAEPTPLRQRRSPTAGRGFFQAFPMEK